MSYSRQPPSQSVDQSEPAVCTAPNGTDNSFMNYLLGSGGVAGAMGREGAVQSQLGAAYNLGRNAPQVDYNGSIFRNTNSQYTSGVYDATRSTGGNGMRYNAGGAQGEQLIYTSPSLAESIGEMHAYRSDANPTGMANRTMVESNFTATTSGGRGGVADVSTVAASEGMSGALTAPKGSSNGPWYYRMFGESPYSMPQQVGKGATDSGASAMRVPSATGGNQIDIIPRNTNANQITPLEVTPYDAAGQPMASSRNVSGINNMVPDASPLNEGMLTDRPGGGLRGSGVRYGAIGGGVMSLGTDLYRMANGEDLSFGQVALDTGLGTATGAGGAYAAEQLMERGLSMRGAGGAVGGVLEGGMSLWNNANAYSNGEIDGGHALANVAVDTGVGIGAGIAGAELGALIGSVVPGAGTAIGAGLGFVGGLVGSWLVHELVEGTGVGDWAKENLGNAFNAIGEGAGAAWDGAKELGGQAWDGAKALGGQAWDGLQTAGGAIANTAGAAWEGAKDLGSSAWEGAKNVGGAVADTAGAAWEGAKDLGSSAWDAVTSW